MSPRDYEFTPPPPRNKPAAPAAEVAPLTRRRMPLGLLIASIIASATALALIVAISVIWGPASQPQALDRPSESASGPTSPGDTRTPAPTTSPEPVTPGSYVPITQNAQFTQGLTIVPPDVGDWYTFDISNRPDQFSANRKDYSAQIEVWQTDLFTSPQSDQSLSQSQLHRIDDECRSSVQLSGGVGIYVLTGSDGTQLELLGQRGTHCEGGEILLIERLMPHSGTRIHIVLWTSKGLDNDPEVMELLYKVTFTVP